LRRSALAAAVAAACTVPAPARAQSSPFVPEAVYRHLANELSGDRAFEHDRSLSRFHKTDGSRDFFKAAEVIRQAAVDGGLEDVRLVRQKWDGHGWSCNSGEAWLMADPAEKLASYGDVAMSIADHSRTTHVVADLVDVGAGVEEADYKDRDVKGKIVLASGSLSAAHREAVWKRGALGVLSHMTNRPTPLDAPDQLAWGRLPYEAKGVDGVKEGTPSTFAVMISPRRGQALQRRLATATTPLKLKVDIESAYPERQEQAYVEAWIKGTEIHDQQVVLTAHMQENTSANDDGSGCSSLLEVGRALSRLIKEGKLPRPRRDIRFWWVNEFESQQQFFSENQKEARRMLVNVNQDMVGARQSWGGRVQYGTRMPWSLPHALEDVMESVLGMVRDGNTTYLTHRGTTRPQPFTREVTAVKGSREPFHARMIPYHGSTDHHAFTPAPIGVPATTLTNWPDEFIHSTGDDLEQVDATQLERNAMVVSLVSWYFATAGEEEAAALAAYVASRGASRIAGDLAAAVAHVAQAAPAERPSAFRAGRNLIRHSHRKELAALASVRRLGPRGRAGEYVTQAGERLESTLGDDLRALERAYFAVSGQNLPNVEPARDEEALDRQVYVPVADYATWLAAMQKVKAVEALHPMMRFEVYNFADGKRSALEVYEAVAAEALSAGEWYYGTVKAADVKEALERAAQAGAFTVRKK
jgi:hypothetical protein